MPAGRVIPQIAGPIDLLPTLTSLAKIPRVGDQPLDGRDLSPLLLSDKVDWPDRMLFTTWSGKYSVRSQTHRLDDQGRLYDMTTDPGQTSPVNESQPETAAKLKESLDQWRSEMFGNSNLANASNPASPTSSIPPANRPQYATVDPRPFPVGYREFPHTRLPARDGEPMGGVRRSSSAPNCSYFVNWTAKEDQMVWLIDVHTTGQYSVTIDYTCPEPDAGSLIELAGGEGRVTGRVTPGWNPPLYTNQDTLPRPPGESKMKEFRPLSLGVISLKKGQTPLTLRALEIPGKSVMDVRSVTLTLLP